MYLAHPSRELNDLFAHQPYQGQRPANARFLFVGLDANYHLEIEAQPVFQNILEYHRDGVAFWRDKGVHHPFLLPSYFGDGKLYHQNFQRLGVGPQHAHLVSFIELLHVPTVGRSKLVVDDLDEAHLEALAETILEGQATHVFMPDSVVRLMRATGIFPWLPRKPMAVKNSLGMLYQQGPKTVYSHLHFSNWGKFRQRLLLQAAAMRSLLLDEPAVISFLAVDDLSFTDRLKPALDEAQTGGNATELTEVKSCSICGEIFPMEEFCYGNRVKNSYCQSCNRAERAAYKAGGRDGTRLFRESMRSKWQE